MVGLTVSLPVKWEQFLKRLADDHEINLNTVASELCEWALSDPEGKEQFKFKLTHEGKFIVDWLSQCFNVFNVAMIEFS